MKIVYVITKSEIGGAQTHVLDLLKEGLRLGHQVSLISSPGGWLEDQVRDLNIKFFPNKFFRNSYNPANLFLALGAVRRVIKELNPSVVHCHSGGGGFYGRLATFGLPVKMVFTVHGWSFRPGAPILQRIISLVAELLMKPLTDKFICVSSYDQNIGISSGVISEKSSVVIHNGVVVSDISTKEAKEKITIIFAGRLSAPKRQDIFLKSIALLDSNIKNKINVNIIGDGPNKESIENLSENLGLNSLISIKSLPTELMGKEYSNSDILVLISDYEAFPMVIIEAMSYGLPVVVSSVGGIPEAVNASVGALVSKNNPEDFAKEITALILSKGDREKKGQNARKLIEEKFTINKMLDKTFSVYRQLVSEDNLDSLQDNTKI